MPARSPKGAGKKTLRYVLMPLKYKIGHLRRERVAWLHESPEERRNKNEKKRRERERERPGWLRYTVKFLIPQHRDVRHSGRHLRKFHAEGCIQRQCHCSLTTSWVPLKKFRANFLNHLFILPTKCMPIYIREWIEGHLERI